MNRGMDGLDMGVQVKVDRRSKEAKPLKKCGTVLRDELHGQSS